MNLKDSEIPISSLQDWEILLAFSYCRKTLEKVDEKFETEFNTIRDNFFGGDERETRETLEDICLFYEKEFTKRHAN